MIRTAPSFVTLAIAVVLCLFTTTDAFATVSQIQQTRLVKASAPLVPLQASNSDSSPSFKRVSDEDEGEPIPFLDKIENSFIECYADSIITVEGTDYTIGIPCDYCVALCYFQGDNLLPVELNDELMNDVFPVAENIVREEFEDELILQRTPQTLTLMGELEDDDDDDDEDIDDDEEDDDDNSGEEEVEVLLSFEHRDKEFNLVRMIDPVLLVGKKDDSREGVRVLLTPEESEKIMPILEQTFLNNSDDILP